MSSFVIQRPWMQCHHTKLAMEADFIKGTMFILLSPPPEKLKPTFSIPSGDSQLLGVLSRERVILKFWWNDVDQQPKCIFKEKMNAAFCWIYVLNDCCCLVPNQKEKNKTITNECHKRATWQGDAKWPTAMPSLYLSFKTWRRPQFLIVFF